MKRECVFVKQSIEYIIAAFEEEYNVMLRKEEREKVVCANKKCASAKHGSIGKAGYTAVVEKASINILFQCDVGDHAETSTKRKKPLESKGSQIVGQI